MSAAAERPAPPALSLLLPALLVIVFAGWLTLGNLAQLLPPERWAEALRLGSGTSREIVFAFAALPRVAVALLSGAAIGLSGALFQAAIGNPLAEPTLLGTAAGAQAALLAAVLWFPAALDLGYGPVAVLGAAAATGLVFAVAGGGSRALSIILAGLIVNLTLGTLCAVAVLFHPAQSEDLLQWQSGRLEQNGWGAVPPLLAVLVGAGAALTLLARPLKLLALGDEAAGALGLRMALFRPLVLLLAVILAASVVAAVGMIGFLGLAVPALVRLLGARTVGERLAWSPVFGAALLLFADQAVQLLSSEGRPLPTGITVSLLCAPVLLLMLRRLPLDRRRPAPPMPRVARRPLDARHLAVWLVLVAGAAAVSLGLGRTPAGWEWAGGLDFVLRWRVPRAMAAASAGLLLGLTGAVLQRATANPMASPEVLGVSSGATLGAILAVLLLPAWTPLVLLLAATVGALAVTAAILALGWRAGFSPDHILLTGVALGAVVGALAALVIAAGGPERMLLLSWMSGSTYRVTLDQALVVTFAAGGAALVAPLLFRSLDILPLGDASARALGVNTRRARGAAVALSAVATAAATTIVGPASFIGLLAPHMVRRLGFYAARTHLPVSALAGALLMLVADFFGRTLLFPWQVPAGLLATLIGGPFFLVLLGRRR